MSEHIAKAVEKRSESSGQVSVLIRCCDDTTTDSWHTLSVSPTTTADDVTAWLAERKAAVQEQHAAHQAAVAALDSISVG